MDLITAQHNEAKARINKMIELMGLDDFIQFYIDANEKINRRIITRKEVLGLVENTPKYMTWLLETLRLEFEREVSRNAK